MSKLNKILEGLDYRQYSDQSGYIGGLDPGKAYAVLPAKRFEQLLALMDEQETAPEWKVGDWAEYGDIEGKVHRFKVLGWSSGFLTDKDGNNFEVEFCRHVPPPAAETLGDMERQERIDREIAELKIKLGNLEREVRNE